MKSKPKAKAKVTKPKKKPVSVAKARKKLKAEIVEQKAGLAEEEEKIVEENKMIRAKMEQRAGLTRDIINLFQEGTRDSAIKDTLRQAFIQKLQILLKE
ncbi:MAG TPA: hypothetical protein ENG14_07000 [Thermodesulforhabdus norvegica]|uniref:Uncharacterized protein n=1 Tax=Thermodesulforhabdus norvegica TaxID=39841 RepID=A0A7C0WT00_9BACT|nr:hypothetical protein [Thermodesulforhabdus norvegica]